MFCIKWDDSLSVGVPQFDEDHKQLVELLNKTYNACICNNKDDQLESIVNELIEYTHGHISDEEYLMEKYAYPETRLHKIEHGVIIDKLNHIQKELQDVQKNPSITLLDLAMLLGHWLSDHIMKIDKRFGRYIAELNMVRTEP